MSLEEQLVWYLEFDAIVIKLTSTLYLLAIAINCTRIDLVKGALVYDHAVLLWSEVTREMALDVLHVAIDTLVHCLVDERCLNLALILLRNSYRVFIALFQNITLIN